MILNFHCNADEICAPLGYNTVSSGNLPTFQDNVSVPSSRVKKSKKSRESKLFLDFLTLEDGTDRLSRNVGKGLPLDAALYLRRVHISK
jgi:hypothetical protein